MKNLHFLAIFALLFAGCKENPPVDEPKPGTTTEPVYYAIELTDDGNGTATATIDDKEVDKAIAAAEVTITATPEEDYKFKKWVVLEGDMELDSETAASTTFTMPEKAVKIRAEFEPIEGPVVDTEYDITLVQTTGGQIFATLENGAPATKAKAGTEISIRAMTASDDYAFVKWIVVSGDITLEEEGTVAQTKFTMPAEAVSIKAEFVAVVKKYTVSVSSSNATQGTASAEVDGVKISESEAGKTITIVARPVTADWEFDKWTVEAGGITVANTATTTFTMPAEIVRIKADFKKVIKKYAISVTSTDGGTGAATLNGNPIAEAEAGTMITLDATVGGANYIFDRWTTESAGVTFADPTAAHTTFIMPENAVAIKAEFLFDDGFKRVVIPDAALRAHLAGLGYIEDENDGNGTVKITDENGAKAATKIDIKALKNVVSIVGLDQLCPNVTELELSENKIVTLDVTGFEKLTTLTYSGAGTNAATSVPTPIESLDAHGLKYLKKITMRWCASIKTIDISGCTALNQMIASTSSSAYLLGSSSSTATTAAFNLSSGTIKTYYDTLESFKAEGCTQITSVTHPTTSATIVDIRIENISFKNCTALNSMSFTKGSDQVTAVTFDITNTPVAADATKITGANDKFTFIK